MGRANSSVGRLPPVVPFALANYAFSITDVSFSIFFTASAIGVTPACIAEAYLGALCSSFQEVFSDPDDETGSLAADLNLALRRKLARYQLFVGVPGPFHVPHTRARPIRPSVLCGRDR
jgi:uncharacterized membrane protein YdjX (TVP38/TMEM64 family)